jgi:tol-pal system protein YbgF
MRKSLTGTALILFTVTIFLVGCAATNSYMEDTPGATDQAGGDTSELDQLLGSGSENSDETVNEEDVLRLLGVNDQAASESSLTPAEQSQSDVGSESEQIASSQGQSNARVDTAIPAWKSDSFSDRYQEALQTYRSHRYLDAVQKFEALIASNAKHSLADNCQYWIGEAYYDQGNYTQAIVAFEKVFTYPGSNKDDSAQLKLGLCYVKLNDKPKAKDELQKLVNNYPNSEFISIAKRFIAQLEGSSPSQ